MSVADDLAVTDDITRGLNFTCRLIRNHDWRTRGQSRSEDDRQFTSSAINDATDWQGLSPDDQFSRTICALFNTREHAERIRLKGVRSEDLDVAHYGAAV